MSLNNVATVVRDSGLTKCCEPLRNLRVTLWTCNFILLIVLNSSDFILLIVLNSSEMFV